MQAYGVIAGKNGGNDNRPGRKGTRHEMSETRALTEGYDQPTRYEIRIEGHLDDRWAGWFDGLTLTREDDDTTLLTGPVIDQAALHGVLKRIRDLGTPLLSVERVALAQAETPDMRP
jgi:hypothetical protein